MEGSEAGGAERDGGVHHAQPQRHHRAHLPRGGAHGEFKYCNSSAVFVRVESRRILLNHGVRSVHQCAGVGVVLGAVGLGGVGWRSGSGWCSGGCKGSGWCWR